VKVTASGDAPDLWIKSFDRDSLVLIRETRTWHCDWAQAIRTRATR
jgi:hypothetical protein